MLSWSGCTIVQTVSQMSFSLVVLLSYWFPPSYMHFPLLYKLETLCLEVGKPLGTCFSSPQLSVGISDINAGGSQWQAWWHLCTNVDLKALERSRDFALSTPATVKEPVGVHSGSIYRKEQRVLLLTYPDCCHIVGKVETVAVCSGECVELSHVDKALNHHPSTAADFTSPQGSASVSAHHFLSKPFYLCFLFWFPSVCLSRSFHSPPPTFFSCWQTEPLPRRALTACLEFTYVNESQCCS